MTSTHLTVFSSIFLCLAAVSAFVVLTNLSDAARACADGGACASALTPAASGATAFIVSLAAALFAGHLDRRSRSGRGRKRR